MDLTAYGAKRFKPFLRTAPVTREWMEETTDRFAYKCLPLLIANSYGWQICNPVAFSASWTGESAPAAINIVADDPTAIATSHFGSGVITFKIPYVFRTDEGTDLIIQGPTNMPKDGISPLTGVVEADWGPFGFTMNWIFTRPKNVVRFEAGEPICQLWPARTEALEAVRPTYCSFSQNPELASEYQQWAGGRDHLIRENEAQAAKKWERAYFSGPPDSQRHRTKLQLSDFDAAEGSSLQLPQLTIDP